MQSTQEQYDNFISGAVERLGWTEDKVKKTLRGEYQKYSPENEEEYFKFLIKTKWTEFSNSPEEQERRRVAANKLFGPEKCPICGAKTIPDLGWYGKYTKVAGWRCEQGDIQHFIQYKANRIARFNGDPIPFEEKFPVEEVDA